MNFTMLKRIAVNGAKSFARAGSVSFATVLIMTVTLGIIGLLVFLSAVLTHTLDAIKDKVDVNVYFVTSANEGDIIAFQQELAGLREVERVSYTSREDALEAFRARHATDELTLQALEELGDNPLGASLSVKATDPGQYGAIAEYLSSNPPVDASGSSIVDRVNYFQNKVVIDRLTGLIRATEQTGAAIVALFALASAVIVFATVRLAVFTARDEIAVMRLMGASNWFIRGPFIVAGIIAGLVAAVFVLVLLYPLSWWAGESLSAWLGGFNAFTHYVGHFPLFFGILVGSGFFLGGIASWFAVRRYLRI